MKTIDVSKIDIFEITNPKLQLILICLFTDGYVEPDELPEYIQENRGWWGDAIKTSVNGRKENIVWGSGLWVFDREKLSDDTLADFKEKVKASLKVAVDARHYIRTGSDRNRGDDQLSFILTFTDDEPLEFTGF